MTVSIYMYAEKREHGIWKSCTPIESITQNGESSYDMEPIYESHNAYPLSRILFNVDRMNNYGVDAISEPRGLPNDPSPELKKLASWGEEKGWYCNYPSWLLLGELLEFPWDENKMSVTGFVNAKQYIIFKEKGEPEQFASVGVRGVSEAVARVLVRRLYLPFCLF